MMRYLKKNYLVITSVIIGFLLIAPYLYLNGITYEHDTFFHLSRIEGYATSIKNLDMIPTIYPFKNDFFGYPSPSFYSDIYLFIPALIYLLTSKVVLAYLIFITVILVLTAYFMGLTISKITTNKHAIIAAMFVYSYSPYHLSDLYVRSAIGELVGMMFLPLVVYVAYLLFYEKIATFKIALVFTGLIYAHNLSFYLGVLLFYVLIIANINRLNKKIIKQIIIAVIITIGLSAMYTFNLVAFLIDQHYVLSYYSNAAVLADTGLNAFQYFLPIINFNVWSHDFNALVVTAGFLIILLPLTMIFDIKVRKNNFNLKLLVIGYLFLLLTSSYWDYSNITAFSFLQFIWRLMIIPSILLTIVGVISLFNISKYQNETLIILIFLVLALGTMGQDKLINRTNTLSINLPYQAIIDGEVIDPYYSADYKRVELAGGEYLPISHLATENLEYGIYDLNLDISGVINYYNYRELNFSVSARDSYQLPKYYYLGYHLYDNYNQEVTIKQNPTTGLIQTELNSGTYDLVYQRPLASIIGIFITAITLSLLAFFKFKKVI